MSFQILKNPALKNQVRMIQDKTTETEKYRATLERIGTFMAYEVSDLIDSKESVVETNFGQVKGVRLIDENIIFIAILRAAIPLVMGAIKVFPNAQCGMISARRVLLTEGNSEKKAIFTIPIEYSNIPEINSESILILPDSALASGSSVVTVLNNILNKTKPKRIIILSVVCAKDGVEHIQKHYPKAEIITCHLGKGLNSKGFIVPDGPGDAGDRSYGLGNGEHV